MEKKILKTVALMFLVNVLFISNVKAADEVTGVTYEENSFTNEECITETEWQANAKTGYTLNKETGLFELTGDTYQEYVAKGTNDKHVFFEVSDNGKVLTAYVPYYSKLDEVEAIKKALEDNKIILTSSCENTLTVKKAVIGGEYSEETKKEIGEEIADPEPTPEQNTTTTTPTQENTTQQPATTTPAQTPTQMQTIDTPDTASTISIIAIIFGVAAIGGGGYAIYSRMKDKKKEEESQGGGENE